MSKKSAAVFGAVAGLAQTAFSKVASVVSSSIGSAVSRVDTLNNFSKVMGNLGIESGKSDKAIQKLKTGLDGLPTALNDGASAVQRFTSKNGDVEKSADMFLAVNNAILAGGAATERQSSALEQLSQAYSRGKMDMQEWKTLEEVMSAQLKQVAQDMGITKDALGEGLRNGTISMDAFMDSITKLNTEGTGKFASFEEQARTATGGIETSFSNLKTAVDRALGDIINAIGAENIAAVAQAVKDVIDGIGTAISTVIEDIKSGESVLAPIIQAIGNAINLLKPALEEFGATILPSIQQYIEAFVPYFAQIIDTAAQLASAILPAIAPIVSAIFTVLSQALPVVQTALATITPIITRIVEFLTPIIEKITEVITKITSALMPALESIIELVSGIISTILDIVLPIVDSIWNDVLSPILDFITGVVEFVSGVIEGIVDFVETTIMPIVKFVANTVLKPIQVAIQSFSDIVSGIIDVLTGIFTGDFDNVKDGAKKAVSGIIDFFTSLPQKIGEAISKIVGKFSEIWGKVLTKIGEFIGKLVDKFKEIPGKMAEIGKNLIDGLWNGINDAKDWVLDKIKGFGGAVLDGIKGFFGIHSPSTVMRDQVGKQLVRGISVGVEAEQKSAVATVKNLSKSLLKTLNSDQTSYSEVGKELIQDFSNGMDKAVTNMKTKITSVVETAISTLKKQFSSQKSTVNNIYEKFGKEVINGFTEKMKTVTTDIVSATSETIQGLLDDMDSAISEVNNKISSLYSSSTSQSLYEMLKDENGNDVMVLTDMQKATKETMRYYNKLLLLQDKLPDSIISQIVAMDMDTAMTYMDKLLSLSDSALEKYVKGYQERANVAELLSQHFYQSEINSIKTNFTSQITAELKSLQKQVQKIGQQTMAGYIKGLKATDYSSEIQKIAKNVIKTMKKALGIASPSKVFAEIGDFSAQGYVNGFAEGMDLPEAQLRSTAVGAFSSSESGAGMVGGITVNMTNQINNEMDAEDIGRRLMTSIRRATA